MSKHRKTIGTIMRTMKRAFERGDFDAAAEVVQKGLQQRDNKILNLEQALETRNRVCATKRYLEVVRTDGSMSKLTVNPVTGRITLKVSHKSSDHVLQELTELANQLMNVELPPVTLRGTIHFNTSEYRCLLCSESKKFSKSIKMPVKEAVNE